MFFQVTDGWDGLCAFLGEKVPDVPFPNINDKKEYSKMMLKSNVIGGIAWVVFAGIVGGICYLPFGIKRSFFWTTLPSGLEAVWYRRHAYSMVNRDSILVKHESHQLVYLGCTLGYSCILVRVASGLIFLDVELLIERTNRVLHEGIWLLQNTRHIWYGLPSLAWKCARLGFAQKRRAAPVLFVTF